MIFWILLFLFILNIIHQVLKYKIDMYNYSNSESCYFCSKYVPVDNTPFVFLVNKTSFALCEECGNEKQTKP